MARTLTTYVALLRGINVGGKNRLAMKDLQAALEGIGLLEVGTYIQSGNVRFGSDAPEAALVTRVQEALQRRFSLRVPVVLRTARELAKVGASNPFLAPGQAPDEALLPILQVGFLAALPTAAAVAGLDPHRSPPDEFRVAGREVFMRCPNTFGRTKLTTDFFDRGLGTTMTCRNWKTVRTLAQWAQDGVLPQR